MLARAVSDPKPQAEDVTEEAQQSFGFGGLSCVVKQRYSQHGCACNVGGLCKLNLMLELSTLKQMHRVCNSRIQRNLQAPKRV